MFTMDNTQGFNETDIKLMNEAVEVLIADGIEESNACDIVNNNWAPEGNTIESLTAR